MKLFTVTFDDSDVVVVEEGIELHEEQGQLVADVGTDVGGATLAMVPLHIPVGDAATDDGRRVVEAGLHVDEDEGQLAFLRAEPGDDRAFVVLSVIQRSPDARTEVAEYEDGVTCVGNAFERPMDRQLLVLIRGSAVEFRRFGRDTGYGAWHRVAWDGTELAVTTASGDAA